MRQLNFYTKNTQIAREDNNNINLNINIEVTLNPNSKVLEIMQAFSFLLIPVDSSNH
jgi:hypothetical protein